METFRACVLPEKLGKASAVLPKGKRNSTRQFHHDFKHYDPSGVWCPVRKVVTIHQWLVPKVSKERPGLGLCPARKLEGSSCAFAGIAESSAP